MFNILCFVMKMNINTVKTMVLEVARTIIPTIFHMFSGIQWGIMQSKCHQNVEIWNLLYYILLDENSNYFYILSYLFQICIMWLDLSGCLQICWNNSKIKRTRLRLSQSVNVPWACGDDNAKNFKTRLNV